LDGGHVAWALNALTGDPVFRLKRYDFAGGAWRRLDVTMHSRDGKKSMGFRPSDEAHDAERTFMMLCGYCRRKALIGASFGQRSTEGERDAEMRYDERYGACVLVCGLVCGHAYSILDVQFLKLLDGTVLRLLRLRNPCQAAGAGGGSGREGEGWRGPWANGAAEWEEHPWVREHVRPHGIERDGSFWMSWCDFALVFDKIDICSPIVRAHDQFPRLSRAEQDALAWEARLAMMAYGGGGDEGWSHSAQPDNGSQEWEDSLLAQPEALGAQPEALGCETDAGAGHV